MYVKKKCDGDFMKDANISEAAAYIRVSTEEQTEFSPESQLDRIMSYAEKNGYRIKNENIFCDNGISGKNTEKRKGFQAMIEKAKQRPAPFKAVLVWKFSRFARNREDSIIYKSMLRKKFGIKVISVSETIGDDKMSPLIEAMIEAMDEFYSVNLGEEVRRGMTKRAEKGKFQSRAPFGYNIVNGELLEDSLQSEFVKFIFSMLLSGKNTSEISETLNKMGIKTSAGNLWTPRSVTYLLKNPVYAGYVLWNKNGSEKVLTKGIHSPLITEKDFKTAITLLNNAKKRNKDYLNLSTGKNPFVPFLRCSSCKGKFCLCGDGKNLQCINYIKGKCSVSHSISLNRLNSSLKNTFSVFFSTIEVKDLHKNEIPPLPHSPDDNLLYQLKARYSRAKAAFERGFYTIEELQKAFDAVSEYEKTHKKNTADIYEKTYPAAPSFSSDRLSPETFLNMLFEPDLLPLEKKESLLASVLEKIVFFRPEEQLVLYFKKDIYGTAVKGKSPTDKYN